MYFCCTGKHKRAHSKIVYFSKIAEMSKTAWDVQTFENSNKYSNISYTWYKSLSMIRVAVKAIRKDKGLMSPFFLIKKVLEGIYPQLSTEIIQKV